VTKSETATPVAPGWTPYGRGPVVVGVDGTARSVGALRWAVDEAARRGVELRAVHACDPTPVIAAYAPEHPSRPAPEQLMGAKTRHLADLVRTALGEHPPVPVREICEPTSAIRALLAHGRGASLLVLATSTDLTTGVGLGSTALACVRQPPCPVVVLPDGSWQ
jgi:nucleotide-binding universal stress UspA family protein